MIALYYSVATFLAIIGNIECLYYYCPSSSYCVDDKCCESPQNITYDSKPEENYEDYPDTKFICGQTENTEYKICCNSVLESKKCSTIDYKKHFSYFCPLEIPLYPGYSEEGSFTLCPPACRCVPTSLCPRGAIHRDSRDIQYSCGDVAGHVCCSLTQIVRKFYKKFSFYQTLRTQNEEYYPKEVIDSSANTKLSEYAIKQKTDLKIKLPKAKKSFPSLQITPKSSQVSDWHCGRTIHATQKLSRIFTMFDPHPHNAEEGDAPWHIAILSDKLEYICSGVVVGERDVVTVAHCVAKKKPKSILIRIGDVDLHKDNERYPVYDVAVSTIVSHPHYDEVNLYYDIAMIELKHSLRGLPNIRPACLPDGTYRPDINKCKVTGFGQVERSKEAINEFSYKLRYANFYILDRSSCESFLRRVITLGPFFMLHESALCAHGYSNADTCHGDGGSGLICPDDETFVLNGLVSWGIGCGYGIPGVYVNVSRFLDFIKNYKTFQKDHYEETNEESHYTPEPYEPKEEYNEPYEPYDPYYEDSNTREGEYYDEPYKNIDYYYNDEFYHYIPEEPYKGNPGHNFEDSNHYSDGEYTYIDDYVVDPYVEDLYVEDKPYSGYDDELPYEDSYSNYDDPYSGSNYNDDPYSGSNYDYIGEYPYYEDYSYHEEYPYDTYQDPKYEYTQQDADEHQDGAFKDSQTQNDYELDDLEHIVNFPLYRVQENGQFPSVRVRKAEDPEEKLRAPKRTDFKKVIQDENSNEKTSPEVISPLLASLQKQ